MHLAYTECITSQSEAAALSFEEWCKQRAERSLQFQFGQLVLKIELDVMTWDRHSRRQFPSLRGRLDEPTMALPRTCPLQLCPCCSHSSTGYGNTTSQTPRCIQSILRRQVHSQQDTSTIFQDAIGREPQVEPCLCERRWGTVSLTEKSEALQKWPWLSTMDWRRQKLHLNIVTTKTSQVKQ